MEIRNARGWAAVIIAAMMCTPTLTAQAGEKAFVWNADDTELAWGPCPEFIPEGCRIAVLQGDPGAPNADIFFKLPPNTRVPVHWHSSAERMILVAGEMQVDYEGQDPVVLTPGTYAYGPAKLRHTATCLDAGECILFIAFEDPVDAVPVHDH